MASGKKAKKSKGKTIALTEFLQDSPASLSTQPIRKSTTNWADEVDDYDAVDPKAVNMVLPTAPKASRDFEDIADKVPNEPPFIAYLSNLPYDVDEDEIADFFKNLKIANMRIPKDDRSGEAPRLKGFGYVEFEDRDSLMSALIIPDTNLKNRRIRIEVAANSENDRRRGGRMGDRMGMGGGADTGGDWRSSNRPEPAEERRGGFNRDRDGGGFTRDREGGSGAFTREGMREGDSGGFTRDRESSSGAFTREGMREGGTRDKDYGGFNRDREGGFNRDRPDREGGFSRDRSDREGGFSRDRDSGFSRNRDQDERPGAWRDGDRQTSNFNERDRDRGFSRGNYRDSDRSNNRFDREERDDRRGGGGFRRYDDNERNGGFTRSSNRGDKDDRESEEPSSDSRQRPKLNLAPRSKPTEQSAAKTESVSVPSASIFGSAKPVDTAERERQIDEKLLKERDDRLTGSDKERDTKNDGPDRNIERGRAPASREDTDRETNNRDTEVNNKDRGPPLRERRDASDDKGTSRSNNRSPDHKKNEEKQDKVKREEKRDRPEKEMPKFQEPEMPDFQGSNKFALLDDGDD